MNERIKLIFRWLGVQPDDPFYLQESWSNKKLPDIYRFSLGLELEVYRNGKWCFDKNYSSSAVLYKLITEQLIAISTTLEFDFNEKEKDFFKTLYGLGIKFIAKDDKILDRHILFGYTTEPQYEEDTKYWHISTTGQTTDIQKSAENLEIFTDLVKKIPQNKSVKLEKYQW